MGGRRRLAGAAQEVERGAHLAPRGGRRLRHRRQDRLGAQGVEAGEASSPLVGGAHPHGAPVVLIDVAIGEAAGHQVVHHRGGGAGRERQLAREVDHLRGLGPIQQPQGMELRPAQAVGLAELGVGAPQRLGDQVGEGGDGAAEMRVAAVRVGHAVDSWRGKP
jgi:hypothetical protein